MHSFLCKSAAFCGAICAALILTASIARANDTEQLVLDALTNGTSVSRAAASGEVRAFLVGAEAGQSIDLGLSAQSGDWLVSVMRPDGSVIWTGTNASEFPQMLVLDQSGTFRISVQNISPETVTIAHIPFRVDVNLSGELAQVVQGDYADGLQGGPDFFVVKTKGGRLNLRAQPSLAADRLILMPNGQTVRNLGCRMSGGQRWCKIQPVGADAPIGWSVGTYLIEGVGPEGS